MLAIGDCLQNRYRVIRQLGHGGMGTVYEAHDERFENSVALKEVLIDLAKIADPKQQEMVARAFEREAKTLALLHHEAFPHVIDYFSERDHQYLIMELIRGEDLGEQLQARKKPFEFEEVLDWTTQLLDALDYLHTQEQPIIHRDLKPQNMKITARGKVKVLDFGIAKGADNKSSSTITNQTFVAATLNYSPIEQLLRVLDPTFRDFISQRHKEKVEDILEHTADARSDLYSLGATLYQLLTATQPHDTLKRALDIWAGKPDPLPNPMELNPQIPPYFNSILLKSMEIDRDSRFVSAVEMQEAIKQFLKDESHSQNEARHAAWIAEQQSQNALPQTGQLSQTGQLPQAGQQTQLRIAEEQKFLAELETPRVVKIDTLSSVEKPPPTLGSQPSARADEEERRRIAEQQKFLAELDGSSAPPPQNQAPPPQAAMTDYGQVQPSYNQQQRSADQTSYSPQGKPSVDQTQVSYLAGVLPEPAKAQATVINPPVRNEPVHQAPIFAAAEPAAPKSKLLWLVPVGVVGALLLVSVIGVVAYFALRTAEPGKISNSASNSTRATETNMQPSEPTPSAVQTPNNVQADAQNNTSNQSTAVSTPTPKTTTAPTPKREVEAPKDKAVAADRPPARVPDANPKPPTKPVVRKTPSGGGVADCKILGEC